MNENNKTKLLTTLILILGGIALVGAVCLMVISPGKKGKNEPVKLNEWYSFAQSYKITVEDSEIVEVKEKNVTPEGVDTGGVSLEITVTGKKEGTTKVNYTVVNEYNDTSYSKEYTVTVDKNLKVTKDGVVSVAKFREGHILTKTHKVSTDNDDVVSISEEQVDQGEVDTGGALYEFTVTAKKEGDATVILEIMDEQGHVETLKKYQVNINDDMTMSLYEIEE